MAGADIYDRARDLINGGNLDQAASVLSTPEARQDPVRFRDAAFGLASRYYSTERVSQALPWLEKLSYPPGTRPLEVSQMLALSYIQSRQFDRAVDVVGEIYHEPARSPRARLLTARLLMREQFEDAAEDQLRKAATAQPKLVGLHQLLGELALFRSQPDRAVEEFRQELTVNPVSAVALYKLGDAFTRLDRCDTATELLERSVWLDPSHSGPYILLGKCSIKKQQLPTAAGFLRRAIRLDPRNYTAHFLLGQTLIQMGETEEGKRILDRSQELKKESGQ